MDRVLSYPKAEAPYQSCWLIITKSLIINRICLKAVLSKLEGYAGRAVSTVDLDSTLEDLLSKLNARLNLPSFTLEQARISANFESSAHGRQQTIRHCEMCISLNYHSSLFQNPILEKCPVHGYILIYCKCCTTALNKNGSLFTRPLIKKQTCEHLRSLAQSRIPVVKLSKSDSKAFGLLGDEYQNWLSEIERLSLGAVSAVIPKVSSIKDLETSEFYFEYIRSRVGLPFGLYWQSADFSYEVCRVDYTSDLNGTKDSDSLTPDSLILEKATLYLFPKLHPEEVVDDVVKSVKSMRRHFFKSYVKPHRKCFNEFKKLSHDQLNNLNFSNRCSCVSAYCAWLVSSGGVSTFPEYCSVRSVTPMEETFTGIISPNPPGVRDILITQFVSFFDVWGALVITNANQEKHHNVIITRASITNDSFVCMNASYTLTRREMTTGRLKREKSYIISPSKLGERSQSNCFGAGQKRLLPLVAKVSRSVYVPPLAWHSEVRRL